MCETFLYVKDTRLTSALILLPQPPELGLQVDTITLGSDKSFFFFGHFDFLLSGFYICPFRDLNLNIFQGKIH